MNFQYWNYLEDEKFDFRLRIIADYLKDKIAGKQIVDLDCSTARLLQYIPEDYAGYYGNDIDPERVQIAESMGKPRTVFAVCDDSEVSVAEIDILLTLGFTQHNHPVEPVNLFKSVRNLVRTHKPEIVIVESVDEYGHYSLKKLKDFFLFNTPYSLEYEVVVRNKPGEEVTGDNFFMSRQILFYSKG